VAVGVRGGSAVVGLSGGLDDDDGGEEGTWRDLPAECGRLGAAADAGGAARGAVGDRGAAGRSRRAAAASMLCSRCSRWRRCRSLSPAAADG